MAGHRVAHHNARKRKDGKVLTKSKHNDRTFDISKASHIDVSRQDLNFYCMNPDLGIDAKTFAEQESIFYESRFSEHISKTNERAIKSRHKERMISAESMQKNPRTCPEESLIYFGDKEHDVPREVMLQMVQEFLDWRKKEYPLCVSLNWALHCDENGAKHVHDRHVWLAHEKDGHLIINQNKSFAQMGYANSNKQYDNAKKDFSIRCREKQIEIARSHGFEIEEVPEYGKGGQDLADFKLKKAEERIAELEKMLAPDYQLEEIMKRAKPVPFRKGMVMLHEDELKEVAVLASQAKHEHLQNWARNRPLDKKKEDEMRFHFNKEMHSKDVIIKQLQMMVNFAEKWLESHGLAERFFRDFKISEHQKEIEKERSVSHVKNEIEQHHHH